MYLEWTGERLVTQINNVFGTYEHLHRYAIALEYCKSKVVLDVASGEGYGTMLISKIAHKAIGIDISEAAVNYAKSKYTSEKIEFICAPATQLPLSDASIDVVVSFETIEHLTADDQLTMLKEIKRVLRTNGILIMSTPDKTIYGRREENNVFHLHELTKMGFQSLINRYFKNQWMLRQSIVVGSLIEPDQAQPGLFKMFDGDFTEISEGPNMKDFFNTPFFYVTIASDSIINKPICASLFSADEVYDNDIRMLQSEIAYLKRKPKGRFTSLLKRVYKKMVSLVK